MGNFNQIKQLAKNLLIDDRGQSTTEYILILAVVVMIAVKFKSTFGQQLQTAVQSLGGQINSVTQDLGTQN